MIKIYLILLGLLVLPVIFIQVRTYCVLKNKNKFIQKQSDEIKRQNIELSNRNQMLHEINQERQQIIWFVSHDLKGPFNQIFALIQLMKASDNTFSQKQLEYIKKINEISVDGLNMVRNLLDARELNKKHSAITLEAVDVASYISNCVKNYADLGRQKNIKIIFRSPDVLKAVVDISNLRRIAENLISNALKFSQSGKSIKVILEEVGDAVKLSVIDEGPGISREDQSKLFKQFQKLSARPTGGESSTGLGLSIVKTLTEKIDGEVECVSELGKGAKFTVTFKKSRSS